MSAAPHPEPLDPPLGPEPLGPEPAPRGPEPAPRGPDPLVRLRGRRDAWPWVAGFLGLPVLGAAGIAATASWAPDAVAEVALVVAALVVVGALAVALAATVRARRAAEVTVAQLVERLDAVREEAVKDELTGLLNRRGLVLVGTQVLESARRSGGGVHACVLSVTPAVQLGAGPCSAGELRAQQEEEWSAAAAALRGATRTSDVVAREEEGRFLVLGPGAGLHAQELERRVRAGLAQGRPQGGDRFARSTVEVGAAVLAPWDDGGVEDLLVRAEQSLSQRRALRRSSPQHGWSRRRHDSGQPRTDRPGA